MNLLLNSVFPQVFPRNSETVVEKSQQATQVLQFSQHFQQIGGRQ